MKKRMRGIALFIVLVSSIVFCGGIGEADASAGTDNSASNKGTELVLWTANTEGTSDRQDYSSAITDFEAAHPGVTIKMETFEYQDYQTRIKSAAASNTLPDMFLTLSGGFFESFVTSGAVLCLDDYYKAYSDDITMAALSSGVYDGKLYGSVATQSISVLWYNKAMFEAQGLTVPATGDELMTVCRKFKDAGIQPFGLSDDSTWALELLYDTLVLQSAGAEKVSKTLKKQGQSYRDADFLKAATTFKQIADIGDYVSDTTYTDYADIMIDFRSEKIPMFITGSWEAYNIMENAKNPQNFSVAPVPVINSLNSAATDFIGGGNDILMVAASTKYPDLAAAAAFELTRSLSGYDYLSENAIPAWKVDFDDSNVPVLRRELKDLAGSATSVTLWSDTLLAEDDAYEYLSLLDKFYKDEITAPEFVKGMDAMLRN